MKHCKRWSRSAALRRKLCLGLVSTGLAVLAGESAWAAADVPARKYLAISLLGDKVQMVSRQAKTGTHLDANLRESFELKGGVFDQAVLATLAAEFKDLEPKSSFQALKLAPASVLGDPTQLLEGERFVSPAVLTPVLQQLQATHLILIRPHRGESRIKTQRERQGTGVLEGLGLFIDRETPVTDGINSDKYYGFLAPFTYFKVALIDLNSGKLERELIVMESEARISHRKEAAADPWEVMSNVEKVEFLRDMLKKEVKALLPALLARAEG